MPSIRRYVIIQVIGNDCQYRKTGGGIVDRVRSARYARCMELAGIVIMALFVVATLSIGRARHIGVLVKIGWLVIVLVLPVLGPILWFAFGQRYAYRVNGETRQ
jgi:uncharacterized membrane protein